MPGMYQIGVLGRPGGRDRDLRDLVERRFDELGISRTSLNLIDEVAIPTRDRKSPFVGVFFGYDGATDANHPSLNDLIADSVVILPIVPSLGNFSACTPQAIRHINGVEYAGDDAHLEKIVSVVFENFRLLRPERRLFISYRRVESQAIAIQLYEKLDAIGFDVFLDTRGVPPAADFQDVLWHRLADSDVIVLLDTPDFRASRWTREELARANSTSIQILHVLWPGVSPDAASAFSEFLPLDANSFVTSDRTGVLARLEEATADLIGTRVESLRARALSSRHRFLVDNFCDQARSIGCVPVVQPERFITVELVDKQNIAVVPAVGIPNAIRYQEIEDSIAKSGTKFAKVWLLYDERGILENWLVHVDWLNQHLPLTAVRVSEGRQRLTAGIS